MKDILAFAALTATLSVATQSAQAQTTPAAVASVPGSAADEAAVKTTLTKYQQAVQKLDTTGTHRLFTANSQVFESGAWKAPTNTTPPTTWRRS
ncbi:hypothetical protein H9L05_22125 (plasmid) [Hymenobacter qilianensis]|uniref:Nuclear transport factor 2 family protein n=1 Tax=Hymenobacter qilianensis TaxID=1385715 RepID=A0A7H0H1G0_9BACT|nr:hypothetical protein [Hymenobacter qilianensis]QNP54376.1 hypothetical protein H9L05_22125 [Hymenobacter qilianensis]